MSFPDACKIAVICDATDAANSKIGWEVYFERTHFFYPNKIGMPYLVSCCNPKLCPYFISADAYWIGAPKM
jgi:hypothetical protein